MSPAVLDVDNLSVGVAGVPVLREVSFEIAPGEAVGLVGESGAGKSMTARAVARLLSPAAQMDGSVKFQGEDVFRMSGPRLREARAQMGFVYQDPVAHINPVRTVGHFMTEQLRRLRGVSATEASDRAAAGLAALGVSDPRRRLGQYPRELSGGLLQRVVIAASMLTDPVLMLADEPTTALDVTTQAEVAAILDDLRRTRDMALLFITHDLDLATAICDRIAVMYAGQIIEIHPATSTPLHPYTAALAAARPDLRASQKRLSAIAGRPASAAEVGDGCAFAPRCRHAACVCEVPKVALRLHGSGSVRCVRADELGGVLGNG